MQAILSVRNVSHHCLQDRPRTQAFRNSCFVTGLRCYLKALAWPARVWTSRIPPEPALPHLTWNAGGPQALIQIPTNILSCLEAGNGSPAGASPREQE